MMDLKRKYFDDGIKLDPQTISDLMDLEEILQSGQVKIMELGADNLVGIEEVLKTAKKMKVYKRPMTVMMWKLHRLGAELNRGRFSSKRMRMINWHVDDCGMIAYFSITTYWRNVANAHLKVKRK